MAIRRSFLLVSMCVLLLSVAVYGGPKLELTPPTYEWGRQETNDGLYEFKFVLKNVGDEQLEIVKVRSGCGCTKVEVKSHSLAPGESTQMTGTLETKGIEGSMRKGVILTTNDADRKTTIASLDIRFPYAGEGLRFKYDKFGARLRRGALWGYVYLENCEAKTPIVIQALELPEGWDCADKIPVTVPPEERQTLRLFKKVDEGEEPEAFDGKTFKVITDFEKTAELQGTLSYRPRPAATIMTRPGQAETAEKKGSATVRWPMTTPLKEDKDGNE